MRVTQNAKEYVTALDRAMEAMELLSKEDTALTCYLNSQDFSDLMDTLGRMLAAVCTISHLTFMPCPSSKDGYPAVVQSIIDGTPDVAQHLSSDTSGIDDRPAVPQLHLVPDPKRPGPRGTFVDVDREKFDEMFDPVDDLSVPGMQVRYVECKDGKVLCEAPEYAHAHVGFKKWVVERAYGCRIMFDNDADIQSEYDKLDWHRVVLTSEEGVRKINESIAALYDDSPNERS